MLKTLTSCLVLLGAVSASAYNDNRYDVGGPQVRYVSWCARNFVVVQGTRGQPLPKQNCSASGMLCFERQAQQGPYLYIAASCVVPPVLN